MYATYMHINVSETCLFVFSARLMVDVYSKQAHFFSALANEENSNGFYRHRTHTSRAIWNMLERIGAVGCFFRLLLPRTTSQLYIPHNGRWLPCAVGAHEPGKRQLTVIFCSHVISVGFEVLVRPHISCAPSNWLTPISDFAGFCFILFFFGTSPIWRHTRPHICTRCTLYKYRLRNYTVSVHGRIVHSINSKAHRVNWTIGLHFLVIIFVLKQNNLCEIVSVFERHINTETQSWSWHRITRGRHESHPQCGEIVEWTLCWAIQWASWIWWKESIWFECERHRRYSPLTNLAMA